jgi:hypothetical protein
VEGTSQAVLGSSDQRKIPASLSLFLKSEKIRALLYLGKDLSTGPSVIFDLLPRPTGLGDKSQIMEGPVLRTFSYTKVPHKGGELFIFGNGNTHTNNHVKFRSRPEREKKTNSKHSSSTNRINLQ